MELPIEIPEIKKRLVVNSLFAKDSLITVYISESKAVFDSSITRDLLGGATVELYKNDLFVETLSSDINGVFTTKETRGEAGETYRIEVDSKYGLSTAEGHIPTSVLPQSMNLVLNKGRTKFSHTYHQLQIRFRDKPLERNYYELHMEFSYLDSLFFLGYLSGTSSLFSYDPLVKNEMDIDEETYNAYIVFSDELINGEVYNLPVNFYNISTDYDNTPFKLTVLFNSVSEDYYLYKKKLFLYKQAERMSVWEDITEPVVLHSNVNNAYGIFAGYNVYTDTLYSIGQ